MGKLSASFCFMLAISAAVYGQVKTDPKVRIAALEKQIAEQEKKLADLKAELGKLKPPAKVQLKELRGCNCLSVTLGLSSMPLACCQN
jgi:hypothetical protein